MNNDILIDEMAEKFFGIQRRAFMARIKQSQDSGRQLSEWMPSPKPREKNQAWCWDREKAEAWLEAQK